MFSQNETGTTHVRSPYTIGTKTIVLKQLSKRNNYINCNSYWVRGIETGRWKNLDDLYAEMRKKLSKDIWEKGLLEEDLESLNK